MSTPSPTARVRDALERTARFALMGLPASVRQLPQYWYWRTLLQEAEYWPADRIRRWQLRAMRAVVRHACERTEGYRELYRAAGVTWRDLRTLEDVRGLPFTTKAMLQANVEAFSYRRPLRRYVTTGGSTGIPFGFYTTPGAAAVENAFMHAGWKRFGYRPGSPTAVLRGSFIGSSDQHWSFDPFRKELRLSSYRLTASTVDSYCRQIDEHGIKILQAYPSAFNVLCELILQTGTTPPRLTLVLLGSENVYESHLAKFRKTFPAATLAAWYGHAERAILAPWCEHRRAYHAWPFYGLTEVLDSRGHEVAEAQEGELVGTGFHNPTTPFIRYKTMDVAVRGPSSCPSCRRQFLVLDAIVGRLHEFIVTGRGRQISMTAINFHDDIFDAVQQFQFFQDRPGVISLRYVPKPVFNADSAARIRRGLLEKLGEDVELIMEPVAEVPRTPSGKLRFLEQRLPIAYGDR